MAKKQRTIHPKKKCCRDNPRCKRCPVVCKRLEKAGVAIKRDDRVYELTVTLRKKHLTAARAR